MAAAGFLAVGTTSLGVAASHGLLDGARLTRELTQTLAEALVTARLGCPITVDVEDGFADRPDDVADFVAGLGVSGAGVAGINLEDGRGSALVSPDLQAAKIAAIKRVRPDVFVNARVDTYWIGRHDLTDTLARSRQYVDAGADGIFVPGDLDLSVISQLAAAISAPINVLASSRLKLGELASAGVARISTGSLPYRVALTQAVEVARKVRAGEDLPAALSYAEVQSYASSRNPLGQNQTNE
jgi:2-methylisocitrate lyase-like PEP mutase family enzyme